MAVGDEAELYEGETIEHSMTVEVPVGHNKMWIKSGVTLHMGDDETTDEIWERARTLVAATINERLEALDEGTRSLATTAQSPRQRVRSKRRQQSNRRSR